MVLVEPHAREAWVGNFQGSAARTGFSGAFATPSQNHVCVVSEGQAYWVCVDAPREYESLPCDPVTDVRRVPGRDLVVFADFTRLVACGEQGVVWRTDRLSYDGIEITEVGENIIHGVAWDASIAEGGGKTEFRVDASTGRHAGGAAF